MYVLYFALIVLHVPLLLEGNTHLSSAIIQSTYRILGIFCEVYISQIHRCNNQISIFLFYQFHSDTF